MRVKIIRRCVHGTAHPVAYSVRRRHGRAPKVCLLLGFMKLPLLLLHRLMRAVVIADVRLSYCRVQAAKMVGLMMRLPVVSACLHAYIFMVERLTRGVHLCVYEHGCENVGWNATSRCVRGYVLARVEYTRVWRSLRSLLRW